MGNNQSTIDPVHIRIYSNIIQIHDPLKRVQMINTCLASMEYVGSAKRAGIYGYLLNYISTVTAHGSPPLLPGEQNTGKLLQIHLNKRLCPIFLLVLKC